MDDGLLPPHPPNPLPQGHEPNGLSYHAIYEIIRHVPAQMAEMSRAIRSMDEALRGDQRNRHPGVFQQIGELRTAVDDQGSRLDVLEQFVEEQKAMNQRLMLLLERNQQAIVEVKTTGSDDKQARIGFRNGLTIAMAGALAGQGLGFAFAAVLAFIKASFHIK